ncbi:MAG: S28 family serine protease [Saprospiraceae bacterium]|nr:S28 family serine protease [Saprospiraceae bacterium]
MKFTHLVFFFVLSVSLQAQSDIEKNLFELPDVIFTKIKTPDGYQSAYKLMIKQPLDHKNPSAGHFYQKVYFSHMDYSKPTAIITNGYQKNRNNITEVARLTNANQLNVEHRYFGESMPKEVDYTYLNFEQVTADLHRIRMLFDEIYQGKWISTGISKGGTTTIFYKYFYPDDVDVSIPYVAPLNYEYEEQRIYDFLDNIGTKECRNDLLVLQKELLKKSDEIIPLLKWYVKGRDLKFNYLSLEEAYEYAVLELPFSFWQYGKDCAVIPSSGDTEKQMNYLLDIVGLDFFSDRDMEAYGSHYYQSATQMGYYGYETEDFKGLLKYLPYEPHPHAAFVPNKMKVMWDGTITNKAAEWIAKNGNNMLYINGALDTWSATAVPPSKNVNSKWFFMKDKHHASARIKNMTDAERLTFVDALEKWLEIDIE